MREIGAAVHHNVRPARRAVGGGDKAAGQIESTGRTKPRGHQETRFAPAVLPRGRVYICRGTLDIIFLPSLPTPSSPLPLTACLTLDLEPDHAGRAVAVYEAWRSDRLDALMDVLDEFQVPLSAFVVGRSIEQQPEGIARLRRRGVEFHLHSYSHNLSEPDSAAELDTGIGAFVAAFGERPIGYRAPEGRISAPGLSRLAERGFLFDSSVFPSAWPHPRYLRYPRVAYRSVPSNLLEIPIATAGRARLLVTLSFIKLLGFPLYRRLIQKGRVPEPLVFDMHLHDLFVLPAYAQLPAFLKIAYARNRTEGFALLRDTLTLLRNLGYGFTTMTVAARSLDEKLPRC